jgi:hypothetical protein
VTKAGNPGKFVLGSVLPLAIFAINVNGFRSRIPLGIRRGIDKMIELAPF